MPNLKNCLIKKRVFFCCYSGIVFVRLHLYVFSSNVRLPIEYGLWWCFSFLACPPGFGRFPLPVRWHRIDIGSNSCPFDSDALVTVVELNVQSKKPFWSQVNCGPLKTLAKPNGTVRWTLHNPELKFIQQPNTLKKMEANFLSCLHVRAYVALVCVCLLKF